MDFRIYSLDRSSRHTLRRLTFTNSPPFYMVYDPLLGENQTLSILDFKDKGCELDTVDNAVFQSIFAWRTMRGTLNLPGDFALGGSNHSSTIHSRFCEHPQYGPQRTVEPCNAY